jgi:DNA-binding transcriptional LysR family regulator
MLDVARLRVLVAVAEHRSVTAAAKALNFAQPSVSHHLTRLQAETGVQLIARADLLRRLTRSADARAAYDRAIELAANSAEITHLTRRRDQLTAWRGCPPSRVRLQGDRARITD